MLTELKRQAKYFRPRIARLVEDMYFKLAWLLPRKLVYYVGIRLWAHATQGDYSTVEVPAVLMTDALGRWEK